MKEEWKDVVGYEGRYSVSSLGRVRSNSRTVWNGKGNHVLKERIMKQCSPQGYPVVNLTMKNRQETRMVHHLIAESFLDHTMNGHKGLLIDHIDNNQLNNNLKNLQLVTARTNNSKDRKNKTSKYTGVSWCKTANKWRARIRVNNKYKSLGVFKDEYKAHLAYQTELTKINK